MISYVTMQKTSRSSRLSSSDGPVPSVKTWLLSHAKILKVMSMAITSSSRVSRLFLMATASLDVC